MQLVHFYYSCTEANCLKVLKLLGLKKYGRTAPGGGVNGSGGLDRGRRKMYGSMSSLPSVSSIGSRHIHGGGRRDGGRTRRPGSAGGRDRSYNKRFQRLESHVVTLARSVAHLSSEVRNQQLLIQEVEQLRAELRQLRGPSTAGPPPAMGPASTPGHHPGRASRIHAHRVRKLTKFFGDEPPLLRLFLKNLGYEKYASALEEARIGLLELPYLAEDRLERLGVPAGPRVRILQEARAAVMGPVAPGAATLASPSPAANNGEQNYNVYIL